MVTIVLLEVCIALSIILFLTRLTTGRAFKHSLSFRATVQGPVHPPYWIPFFGQYFSLCVHSIEKWPRLGHNIPRTIFSVYVCGAFVAVAKHPDVIRFIRSNHPQLLDHESAYWQFLARIFGAKRRDKAIFRSIYQVYLDGTRLLNQPEPSSPTHGFVRAIQRQAPELVSFNEGIVDQHPWERAAGISIQPTNIDKDQRPAPVETDFFVLVRNLVGYLTSASLIGEDFAEEYREAIDGLWDIDEGWKYFALGLPRSIPLSSLLQAYVARWTLQRRLQSLYVGFKNSTGIDLDAKGSWDRYDDLTDFFKKRLATWSAHEIPIDVRVSEDISMLWNAMIPAGYITFWLLYHIYSSRELLEKIREEISPYIQVTQPENGFNMPEPRRLSFNIHSLIDKCPLLNACLEECQRIYTLPFTVSKAAREFDIPPGIGSSATDPLTRISQNPPVIIEAGTFIIGTTAPDQERDQTFNPERHLPPASPSTQTQVKDKDRDSQSTPLWPNTQAPSDPPPDGKDCFYSPTTLSAFTKTQIIATTAAILKLWDVEPQPSPTSTMNPHNFNSPFARPAGEVKVVIRPTEL